MKHFFCRMLILTMLFVAGCAKDKNVDDYRRETLAKELAKYQAVVGEYTGVIRSRAEGMVLGALKVTVEANTEAVPGADSSKSQGRPGLEVHFLYQRPADGSSNGDSRPPTAKKPKQLSITATQGYFDPDSGAYTAIIPISSGALLKPSHLTDPPAGGGSGAARSIKIVATIKRDGTIIGSLKAMQGATTYEDESAEFSLKRNGPSLDQINETFKPDPKNFQNLVAFAGKAQFPAKSVEKNVNLVISSPAKTHESEEFLDLLLPERDVTATLDFSGVLIEFQAKYNVNTSEVVGDARTARGLIAMSCTSKNRRGDLECGLQTENSPEVDVATVDLREIDGRPPVAEPDPGAPAETRVYRGCGYYTDPLQPSRKTWNVVELKVTYDARKRMDDILDLFFELPEKNFHVVLENNYSEFGKSFSVFQSVVYDTLRKTLYGREVVQGSGGSQTLLLTCEGFDFSPVFERRYKFTCQYRASLNGIDVPLKFDVTRRNCAGMR